MNNELDKDSLQHMPVLALRGLVMFPNMVMHFDVGRKKSIERSIKPCRRINGYFW